MHGFGRLCAAVLTLALVCSCAFSADKVKPRIIDGTPVPTTTFPTVGLFTDANDTFSCTGTLIAPRFVLCAAHCVVDGFTGKLDLGPTQARIVLGGIKYSSVKITAHPSYHGDISQEEEGAIDLSIIELSQNVPDITPSPIGRTVPVVGSILTLVGFGEQGTGATGGNNTFPADGIVNKGTTPIDIVTPTFVKWNFDNRQPPDKESNTAPGDSGGPQFVTVDNVLTVVSVTSGGHKANANFGDLSYNTRTDVAAAWIDAIISGTTPLPPPQIISPLTAAATVGQAFTYAIMSSNFPRSYSATGLPPGLSVDTEAGVISGTPTAAGKSNVTISASNGAGVDTKTLVLTVNGIPVPQIISALTAAATVGQPFTYAITATNLPTGYSAVGLPPGLSFTPSTGIISGTPTTVGVTSITLGAANLGGSDTKVLVLTVQTPKIAPVISSALNASGVVGIPFSYVVVAANNPTAFSTANLPSGFAIDAATGAITGTPVAAGETLVLISASNEAGSDSRTLVLSIGAGKPTFDSGPTVSPNPAKVGQIVQFAAKASSPLPVTILWNFGDGGSAVGENVAHVFVPARAYMVTAAATNSANVSVSASLLLTVEPLTSGPTLLPGQIDSDGDGFDDAIENVAGSSPVDPGSSPTTGALVIGQPITGVSIKLSKKSVLSVAGALHLPANFSTANAATIVAVGEFAQRFKLDVKGTGKTLKDQFKMTYKAKKSVEQNAKFKITLNNFPPLGSTPLTILLGNTLFLKK